MAAQAVAAEQRENQNAIITRFPFQPPTANISQRAQRDPHEMTLTNLIPTPRVILIFLSAM